ncbi:MAG: carbohydrate binding family 9 domain-containing protein [Balneolaceae bacterium]|nr:carbohydrate binding family 9 domain-containing protein [Balneolaceae bacterium]MBO6547339.1 carbohydrate binding family 9 domain-containing protein [Balneolaceae bacterium]MBO6647714.1 carbohydrate binding family 9 domain-containing protein [Balneolaceae bacterium]
MLLFSLPLLAQNNIEIVRLNTPVVLDGIIDEPAWNQVEALPLVQYEPTFQGVMNEETRIKVAYDENFIYVAGQMFTKDVNTIATNSLYRDRYSSDDVLAIVIDGFNDNQNATWFFTNPAGVRFDVALANDADFSGGRNSFNPSYNTFWDVATTQTEEGWFAEMRIPFSSIGILVEDDVAEIGFITYRWISNINERHIFPAIPPNWNLGNAKPSQAHDVRLEGVQSKNPVYITPYGLGGYSSFSDLSADSSAYRFDDDPKAELGFDLKYNVTNNLTLDVTVNTDFAQVEADDQQLNLSRFSLFFPEKRQFFQQRSGLFDYTFGRDRVFYSRRIGLDGDGNPVRILGGGRVTGRVGGMDIGVLNMQTADTDNLPSENFGVVRLRQQVVNERSFVGGIFTSRTASDGSSNLVYGLDGDINVHKNKFFEFRTARSVDSDLQGPTQSDVKETGALRLSFRNQTSTGLLYEFMFSRFGDDYNPELGFVRVGGITQKFTRIGYGWLAKEESVFQRNQIRASYYGRFYNDGHKFFSFDENLQDRSVSVNWDARFKQYGGMNLQFRSGKERILPGDDFDLVGKILIPSGEYSDQRFQVSYEFSEAWKIGGGINTSFGTLYDGQIQELDLNPRFFASSKLELGGSYRITKLQFPDRAGRQKTEFTSHLGQFRSQYAFNKKASINMFVQYSNVSELVGANVRFRYNFSEGRDLWFVFNEQSYSNRDPLEPGLPRLPYLQSRSILLKYTHTFIF